MLKPLILATVFCLGLVTADPEPKDDSLNHYVDLVLDNLQVLIIESGLDPIPLPNNTVSFSDVVLGVTWHGEAAVYDGWLLGLANIYRSDDADFIHAPDGRVVGFASGMGIGNMEGHYKCLAKFMDLGPIADITLKIKGIKIYFEATLDPSTCRFKASVMEVLSIGHIGVDISGLGLLNWIVELVSEMVINTVRIFIKNTVEGIVQDMTNEILSTIDLGVLGPILGCDMTKGSATESRGHYLQGH
ncbi:uncharacterized protein [Panulirus ornatus]|uniref:uncharacterized protein n=1 Tax=Panulirus ornatus TaxID=150431 RepID=UPI003A845647